MVDLGLEEMWEMIKDCVCVWIVVEGGGGTIGYISKMCSYTLLSFLSERFILNEYFYVLLSLNFIMLAYSTPVVSMYF